MRGQFHTAQFPPKCVPPTCVATIFRSSGGGAARKRRRRPVPRQYRAPDSCRTESPERRHSTSVRLTRSSPARYHGRLHPGPVSHHGAGQGSTSVGGSTTPSRQHSRGAAWWDGPGPALPRGPSRDGLTTDSTVDRRRIVAGRRSGTRPPSPNCPLMNPPGGGAIPCLRCDSPQHRQHRYRALHRRPAGFCDCWAVPSLEGSQLCRGRAYS